MPNLNPTRLRDWQRNALEKLQNSGARDFLAVATPGAGKTTFALAAAAPMVRDGRFLIVVVPTSRLKTQWMVSANAVGLDVLDDFANGGGFPPEVHGLAVTYQQVASMPDVFRAIVERNGPAIVVLDEIHHTAAARSWGDAMRHAFERAELRLGLSGTPFREDNNPIPFVRYEGDPPTSQPNHRYGYADALQDQVVRPVEFNLWDSTARWTAGGGVTEQSLLDANTKDESTAIRSALDCDSDYVSKVLVDADRRLTTLRTNVPDAGGLILADTQEHARLLSQRLVALTGQTAVVVTSDDDMAHEAIAHFTAGTEKWMIAVNMVSEGVDIPRLSVGVYATAKRTSMFFQQAIGRFVRTRGDELDAFPAQIYLPATSTFRKLAVEVEIERDHVLRLLDEEDLQQVEVERDGQAALTLRDALAAEDARHSSTVRSGDDFGADEIAFARAMAERLGLRASDTDVAAVIREMQAGGLATPLGTVAAKPATPDAPPSVERASKRKRVSQRVQRIGRNLVSTYGAEDAYSRVYVAVHQYVGRSKIDEYNIDDLDKALDFLAHFDPELLQ